MEGAELILSVKDENGRVYSHDLSKDTDASGQYYYYIDPNEESNEIVPINKPNNPHNKIPEGAIIVAENHVASNAPQLYFCRKVFGQEQQVAGAETYRYVPEDVDSDSIIPYDYTISGSYSGNIGGFSRGNIYADGRKYASGGDSEGTASDCIETLTLKNLVHNRLYVGDIPIYLEGDNYLLNTTPDDLEYADATPLTLKDAEDATLELYGPGTLTIDSKSGITAKKLELHDVKYLSVDSVVGAMQMGDEQKGVEFFHGSKSLPYGFGWLEDMGTKPGTAKTLSKPDVLGTDYYIKIYSTSTDPKAEPSVLLDDKSTVSSGTVRVTPPTDMGVPHAFDLTGNGCKVELINQNEQTVLSAVAGGNYSYMAATNETDPAWNQWKGDLTFDFSTEPFKTLKSGTYTLRVYFEDEQATADKDSSYKLDIPLIVVDKEEMAGNLTVTPDEINLTRGNEKGAKYTTTFEGSTPKAYKWAITPDAADGSRDGITFNNGGSSAVFKAGENAKSGSYTITVTSYGKSDASEDSKLDFAVAKLNVVPKATDMEITCATETPSGDKSYMLNHNTFDGEPKEPWIFDAEIIMDEGEADPAQIEWVLLNGSYSRTKVVPGTAEEPDNHAK